MEPKLRRYYSPWQILVGALVGGPIAAGYLASCDHSAFGSPNRGRATLLASALVLCALVILGRSFTDQAELSMLGGLVAGLYGLYARVAFTAEIAQRQRAGWEQHPWLQTVGISLACSIVVLLLIVLAVLQFGTGS